MLISYNKVIKHKARILIYKLVNLSYNLGLNGERALNNVKHNLLTNKLVVNIYSSFYHLFINPANYTLTL